VGGRSPETPERDLEQGVDDLPGGAGTDGLSLRVRYAADASGIEAENPKVDLRRSTANG
jgi:hypothetical protein